MPTSPFPFRTVLCAFDFSAASQGALIEAADVAERAHATLHLLHVSPLFRARLAHAPGGDPEAAFRDRARAFVDDVLGADAAFRVLAPTVHESHGETPAAGVRRYAEAVAADLVVVGTRGQRGLERLLAGSVAAETLRRSAVPVLVVPERAERAAPDPAAPVLVGVDFSDHAGPALGLARDLAEAYGAPLAVAHVRNVPSERIVGTPRRPLSPPTDVMSRDAAHEALDALLGAAGLDAGRVEQYVIPGRPAAELVALARRAQAGLLVVGTHGRTGWDRLRLGSVAEEVVREAPCPVLVAPLPAEQAAAASTAAAAADTP